MSDELPDGFVVAFVEEEFACIVERVPVIHRIFFDSQLKEREVLSATLGVVRVMVYLEVNPVLDFASVADEDFMNGVLPAIVMTTVDFVAAVDQTRGSISVPAPGVGVARASDVGRHLLECFAPARLQNLIHVQCDAEVDVVRNAGKCAVACLIEAPRLDVQVNHVDAELLGDVDCVISRAGVGDEDVVRVFGGFIPTLDEGLFVLGDGVDSDFHLCADSIAEDLRKKQLGFVLGDA